jgi:hypothetical protein
MSSPTNILNDIADKIEEEKQAVDAKYESKVHLYIQEAFHNAKDVDPQLRQIRTGGGGVNLFGKFLSEGGEFLDANVGGFDWRKFRDNARPFHPQTRRLYDLLCTYDSLLPDELPYIADIE